MNIVRQSRIACLLALGLLAAGAAAADRKSVL